jgi:phage shock protein C
MIGGVCGGLGQYFGIDSTLVRLFFVLAVFTGMSALAYPLLWVIVPREGEAGDDPAEVYKTGAQEMAEQARDLGDAVGAGFRRSNPQRGLFLGAVLVLMGSLFLLESLHIFFLSSIRWDVVWPLILIAGGVILIQRRTRTV